MRRYIPCSLVFLLITLMAASDTLAQWPQDGILLQDPGSAPYNLVSLPLEDGGAIITWYAFGNATDILAQRIDGHGRPLWGAGGLVVCGVAGYQENPTIVSDGAGGCMIFWHDTRSGNLDIYGQRLDGDGNLMWHITGKSICIDPGDQMNPVADVDGQGGAVLAWVDDHDTNPEGLSVTRVDSQGNFVWFEDKIPVIQGALSIDNVGVIGDGMGGCIVTWGENRPGATTGLDIYAQKYFYNGTAAWPDSGDYLVNSYIELEFDLDFEGCPGSPLEDYMGNAFDTQTFSMEPCTQPDNGSGTIDLPPDCSGGYQGDWLVYISPPSGTVEGPVAFTDFTNIVQTPGGGGGLIVTCDLTIVWNVHGTGVLAGFNRTLYIPGQMEWYTSSGSPGAPDQNITMDVNVTAELFGDPDFCSLRFDAGEDHVTYGEIDLHRLGGLPVCTENSDQIFPVLTTDGGGGAIIAWADRRSGDQDPFAQRIDTYGNVLGTPGGDPICPAGRAQEDLEIISDGAGGAILSWTDARLPGDNDIYAQRIDASLSPLWNPNGVGVCTNPALQRGSSLAPDGLGGALVAWYDYRNPFSDIYVQRLDPAAGQPFWSSDGEAVCTASGSQGEPTVCSDSQGGAFLAWPDGRDQMSRPFAQRMDRNGYWGWPAPYIASVRDVPGDQGGQVDLAWTASRLDPWPIREITEYTVWRSITADKAGGEPRPDIRMEKSGDKTIYWQLMETVPAMHLAGYSTTVPTLFDSLTAPPPPHYFQVMAHAFGGLDWASAPDSSYSVDNLAPAVPQGLAGQGVYQPEGLDLSWNANAEPDLLNYVVHRGLDPGFTPDGSNLIATTADTTALDSGWDQTNTYYYKVAAVDIHQNLSGFALLAPVDVTSVTGGEDLPTATALLGNHPNPFNPGTVIRFDLGSPAVVRLRIFDISGRCVCTLADGISLPRGRHQEIWQGRDDSGRRVAAGVYYYRLEAGPYVETRGMTLVK